jgi:hypothetical protein
MCAVAVLELASRAEVHATVVCTDPGPDPRFCQRPAPAALRRVVPTATRLIGRFSGPVFKKVPRARLPTGMEANLEKGTASKENAAAPR